MPTKTKLILISFFLLTAIPTSTSAATSSPLVASLETTQTMTLSSSYRSNTGSERNFDEFKEKVDEILQNKIQKSLHKKIFSPNAIDDSLQTSPQPETGNHF